MSLYEETVRGRLIILKLPPDSFRQEERDTLAARIAGALARADLVLDLSEVELRSDSSVAFRVLMISARSALSSGRRLLMAAPRPILAEKIAINRFGYVIPTHDTVEAAIAAYESGDRGVASP